MDDAMKDDGVVGMICVRCGEVNPERASRCGQCHAPLDDFASSSPWEMGTSVGGGFSAKGGAVPPTKLIIFWGAWLYFSPTAVLAIYILVDDLRQLFSEEELMKPSIYGIIVVFIYMVLSIWALTAVTMGYLRGKKSVNS